MGPVLATFVFWIATISAIVAQVMILRSSRRALRADTHTDHELPGGDAPGGPTRHRRSRAIEWVFAVAPAVAVAFLLYFTWRAAMAPPVIQVEFPPPAAEVGA
ncbi:MAG TPA: hypothetical protein VFM71_14050 [Gemmatimonadaceae bacterium]|nr:hypothetical protein [Gemmatimonadaceae bacterium]